MYSGPDGGFYSTQSFSVIKQLSELFFEPPTYYELCFYCTEGAKCPFHCTPQRHMDLPQMKQSLFGMVIEAFNLQIDRQEYANYDEENVEEEMQYVGAIQHSFEQQACQQLQPKPTVFIDDYMAPQSEQMDLNELKTKNQQVSETQNLTSTIVANNACEESKITCDDIEEIFLQRKSRAETESTTSDNQRNKYQRFRRRQYVCDICDSSFTLKHNIQTHLLLYHPNNEVYIGRRRGKRYRCMKCNKVFRHLIAVQNHQKKEHQLRIRPTCEICQKDFTHPSQLREHISVKHMNLRPFKCTKCSAKFGRRGCLRRHILMRHLNYVYPCPYKNCSHAGFKCSKALNAHIRAVHTHIRPYKCEQCGKGFVRRNDLRVHVDIHNTVLEYSCPKCEQMFQRRIHLQKHIKKCHPVAKSENL